MAFTWIPVARGFGADAKLNITDPKLNDMLPFPPAGAISTLHWGDADGSVSADGNVTLRIAIYTHNVGYRVTKVKVTNGVRVGLLIKRGDYKLVVTRVNEPGSDPDVACTVQVESLLAAS